MYRVIVWDKKHVYASLCELKSDHIFQSKTAISFIFSDFYFFISQSTGVDLTDRHLCNIDILNTEFGRIMECKKPNPRKQK